MKQIALVTGARDGWSLSGCQTPQQQNARSSAVRSERNGGSGGVGGTGRKRGRHIAGAGLGPDRRALIGSAATPQPAYCCASRPGRCAQWPLDYNNN